MDTVLLDKTGTITTGVMTVTGIQPAAGISREVLLRRLGAVEDPSGHPVAAAVSAFARAELGQLPQAGSFNALLGLGVCGTVDGAGAFIMVTSAHSDSISNWEGSGDALIGIHGPLGSGQEIGTTGARISHGCVRLHEADLLRLRDVPQAVPSISSASSFRCGYWCRLGSSRS